VVAVGLQPSWTSVGPGHGSAGRTIGDSEETLERAKVPTCNISPTISTERSPQRKQIRSARTSENTMNKTVQTTSLDKGPGQGETDHPGREDSGPGLARKVTFAFTAVAVAAGLGAAGLGIGSMSIADDTSFNSVGRQPTQQAVVPTAERQESLPLPTPSNLPALCNPLRGDLIDPTPCITAVIDHIQTEDSVGLPAGTGAEVHESVPQWTCNPLHGDLIDPTPCLVAALG